MIIKDAAIDFVDERNYKYSEIAWSININSLPEFCINDTFKFQNQYKEWYDMWCVYYSASEHDNWLNKKDWVPLKSKGSDLCDKSPTRDKAVWDYTINWAKLLKDLWLIDMFTEVQTLEEFLHSISKWFNVHIWSNTINWEKTNNNKWIAVIDKWPWHCVHAIWFNRWPERKYYNHTIPENVIIIKDSSNYFDNWFIYLKFEDFEKALYETKLNFINNKDINLIYKKTIMDKMTLDSAKLFFLLGLTDGTNPQANITREQAMAMNYRILEALVEWKITKESLQKAKDELKKLS